MLIRCLRAPAIGLLVWTSAACSPSMRAARARVAPESEQVLQAQLGTATDAYDAAQATRLLVRRTVSAEDVTEQAIDLDARLKALLVTRERLRQLHEKASSVADVIAVERELARVQGEIDSLEGRLKHLRTSAALAEVQVSLRQKVVLGPLGVVAQALGTVITKLFVIR